LEEAEKISRMSSISLFDRGCFGHFGSIFTDSGRFRPVFWPIFPFFVLFSTWTHGILASKMRPCTIGHPRIVLRYNVCPQPLSKIHFGNIRKFNLHTLDGYFTLRRRWMG
jgi:hypothetical protein